MTNLGTFPFGQPVRAVVQENRKPKRVFVLGVYASAVHARWIGPDGKEVVRALAVASEPRIFWRGEDAASIIERIRIPGALGHLVPADRRFNGPSGIVLDKDILNPLGLSRGETWLCDLVPHSCMNAGQKKAIEREYLPSIEQYDLPEATVPPVPKKLSDESRRHSILEELQESQAEFLILLGDQPIRWFLAHYDNRKKKLSCFGEQPNSYGGLHEVQIGSLNLQVLPLAHPRQIARLGRSSLSWFELHQHWLDSVAPTLLT
jgi:uracil-DNA glycosylase